MSSRDRARTICNFATNGKSDAIVVEPDLKKNVPWSDAKARAPITAMEAKVKATASHAPAGQPESDDYKLVDVSKPASPSPPAEKREEIPVTTAKKASFAHAPLMETPPAPEKPPLKLVDVPLQPFNEGDCEEGLEQYRKGGYHPVCIGEKYKDGKYTVLRKLGYGASSTVWMVQDNTTGGLFAMKVQKSSRDYSEAAYDEIKLLSEMMRGDPRDERFCVRFVDSFETVGPNGRHVCLILERLGDNLLSLIRHYYAQTGGGVPIHIVRQLTRQMLIAMDYFHRERQIIHTDIKVDNIVLQKPLLERTAEDDRKGDWRCKIMDFGNSCKTYRQYSPLIQTREYRCPEVMLGQKYSTSADVWSMGCVVFELITGELMFTPRHDPNGQFHVEEDHLAQMMELLGPMPDRITQHGLYAKELFKPNGELCRIEFAKLKAWPLKRVLREKYGLDKEEAQALTDFLLPMLEYVPEDRATAKQMLDHPWLQGRCMRSGELLPSAQEALDRKAEQEAASPSL